MLGIFSQGQQDKYFDIVKIFAGAIVGSTGANLAASARQR
jgi:hypothetical protein